jgi:predicted dinucleotide-binding enzyme
LNNEVIDMNIGIVGSGHIGGTLAAKLAQAGHDVTVANAQGPQSLQTRLDTMGHGVRAATVEEAERFGEVVIVAIPFGQYRSLSPELLRGKIVVDAGNYYPQRDGNFRQLDDDGATSCELVAEYLQGARVVKGFYALRSDVLRDEAKPAGTPGRLAMPLAGNDAAAKHVVSGPIDEIGFDPVDLGSLAEGGRQIQPGSPVYPARLTALEMMQRLAA